MLELVITLFVVAVILVAIFYIVSIWIYKRAPSNMGFIRTGFLGTKVCLGKGAIVLTGLSRDHLGLAGDDQIRGQPGARTGDLDRPTTSAST